MAKKVQFILNFNVDVAHYLQTQYPKMSQFRILSKSLDGRGANRGRIPRYNYQVEIIEDGEFFSSSLEKILPINPFSKRPIIVGAGPAGLFCALRLMDHGLPSILIERGACVDERMPSIGKFWRYGELDLESNVCFGEGGAGLFSDGKLITRIKSPHTKYVLQRLVDFGAPEEVAYLSNPHLGSNRMRKVIKNISDYLRNGGCSILYGKRVDRLLSIDKKITGVELNGGEQLESDHVILATGHSAINVYLHLQEIKVAMEAKDFAVGVRVEHPRRYIDRLQYGDFASSSLLSASRYRLSYEDKKSKRGTYTFCMCPGGYVLSSGTEKNGLVVNGMSNSAHNSPWSNSAVIVSVRANQDFCAKADVLAGLHFQRSIEQKAYSLSKEFANGFELPAQRLVDFLKEKESKQLPKNSSPTKLFSIGMEKIFPRFVTDHLKSAFLHFDRQLKGFISPDALLIAPETRTSAAVTICRDRNSLQSSSHQGLYPCGEGAGYAGGITSSAVDGVRVAISILQSKSH